MTTDFKTMILPGIFEQSMKGYEQIPDKKNQLKAIDDVVQVLKQNGYDAGAEIFERMMKSAL